MDYKIIDVNNDNIEQEHICCAISSKKNDDSAISKKRWMKGEFKNDLVFKKLDVRGKVFIEYMPIEKAWCPIIGKNYMYINCFWVSGQYKGKGYANKLLDAAIEDSKKKNMDGMTVLSSKKKKPFLSDPKFFKYKGFKVCDTANPYYELLYFPFKDSKETPQFKDICKSGKIHNGGMVIYYTNQCPHTEKYCKLAKKVAEENGFSLQLVKFNSKDQAQNSPSPFTTYSFFYDGKFVTNEILSEKKILKFIENNIEK